MVSLDIIEAIVKIESDASELLQGAEEAKRALPERVQTERKRIFLRFDGETKAAAERLTNEAASEKKDEVSRVRMDFEMRKQRLLKEFLERHSEWEDEMFKHIIGR